MMQELWSPAFGMCPFQANSSWQTSLHDRTAPKPPHDQLARILDINTDLTSQSTFKH